MLRAQRCRPAKRNVSPGVLAICALLAMASAQTSADAEVTFTVRDAAGQPVPGIMVLVHRQDGSAEPARRDTEAPPTVIAQRNATFDPEVTVIPVGTPVSFPNFDRSRHHIYSFSDAKVFEVELYSGTPADPVVFDRAGTVVLGCNIHDWMFAVVHVVDTAWHGLTDAEGRVTLAVPVGATYTATVQHMRVRANEAPVDFQVAGDDPIDLTLTPDLHPPEPRPERPRRPPPPPPSL